MPLRVGRRRAGRAAAVRARGRGLDLGFEFTFLGGQLLDPAGDRAQRQQCAAQLDVGVTCGRAAASRLSSRLRVSGRSSLRNGSGVVMSRSRSWQSPARRALTAPSRAAISAWSASRSPPRVVSPAAPGEHAARRADRIERIGLAARAAFPPQPADLEHLLTAGQEAGQAGSEGAAAFDRERAPPWSVLRRELECVR